MRDIVIFALVFGAIPFILRSPVIGILVWTWLSLMNPHRLTWGIAYSFPFAQIVAIAVFISLLFHYDKIKKPIVNGLSVVWVFFILWMCVTTAFAIFSDFAQADLVKVLKIQIIVFLVTLVIRDQKSIHLLIWVTFLSVGFYGIKGGVFTILTGGQFIIWGPAGSFIADNNHLAVAMLMSIPLGYYLYSTSEKKAVKYSLIVAMLLIFGSVVASYSRGAFIAIFCVLVFFWWSSKKKLQLLLPFLVLVPLGLTLMPDAWWERMETIKTYEEDKSAMGRINAWSYSINVANDRLTGAGFSSWSSRTFAIWAPNPTDVHAAHSIYFGVLADHGWIGLILFLLILFLSWRTASRIIKYSKNKKELEWAELLATMIKVSMVAYMSGGAFLSLAYFDLPWQLMATLLVLEYEVKKTNESSALAGDDEPVDRRTLSMRAFGAPQRKA